MLHHPPRADRRQAEAVRQRRARQRRREGKVVLRVAVSECDVIEALLRSKRLSEEQALRRSQVETAIGAVIGDWSRRWLR